MDQVSHISQHLKTEIESRELGGYYQERICIWPVSKDLRGELGVADQERQQCSKSDCLTLKGQVRLKAQVHHHAPGDSIMSRPLDGELGARSCSPASTMASSVAIISAGSSGAPAGRS
jgi:hypothetical protein